LAEAGELEQAREKWAQASARFENALHIKPDLHDAVYNWASALAAQAQALVKAGSLPAAQTLWDQAQSLFAQHVQDWPQAEGLLAYNWACLYGQQGLAAACVAQLEKSRLANKLPDSRHLQQDVDLEPAFHSAEFQAWWAQHFAQESTA
jgi:tetratricopeptide (TPR) repeat protein